MVASSDRFNLVLNGRRCGRLGFLHSTTCVHQAHGDRRVFVGSGCPLGRRGAWIKAGVVKVGVVKAGVAKVETIFPRLIFSPDGGGGGVGHLSGLRRLLAKVSISD